MGSYSDSGNRQLPHSSQTSAVRGLKCSQDDFGQIMPGSLLSLLSLGDDIFFGDLYLGSSHISQVGINSRFSKEHLGQLHLSRLLAL